MKYLSVNDIRTKYLDFFESKNHLKIPSFSLVPQNDKSLLLINSGMAPLKPFFTKQQVPPSKRVTTCQKCIRTGDIENVGKTARHGTFFEMLGNFSFGEYFKIEAIDWAWEFFTNVIGLPEEKLFVSIYEDDDEAFNIWHENMKIPKEKIFRMGKTDNFWEHGIGPCGPCSEIYYDKGKDFGCNDPNCTVGCDCDRYMEIWNLVFTQFYRNEDGTYTPLDNPNIDTGMGLERLATVLQNVNSIFDIDTIKAIRDKICKISNVKYGIEYKDDVSIRIITDHIRSITFMTADGIIPSNEGRGYVLRRLLRRAVRHGKLLGIDRLFLSDVCNVVIENSKNAYPELNEKKDYILKILSVEEERFYTTLDQGMEILKNKINDILQNNKPKILNGDDTFKLYDTYGFPIDLMKEILEEYSIDVDESAFTLEMEKQRKKARDAREEDTFMGSKETIFNKIEPSISSSFNGYENLEINDCNVLSIISDDKILNTASAPNEISIILDKTPFYAEMGGQVGDIGKITSNDLCINITNCINFGGNKIIHIGKIEKGSIKLNETVTAKVDGSARLSTSRNHTATHILHKVLKNVLGNHIEQAGSLVDTKRLRFDFTHFEAISKDTLSEIENLVNKKILSELPVTIKEMSIQDAKSSGATALFGEKYGDIVRVVNICDYSIELCGGTHLKNSASIGSFKIISENGISAGVRRIEAVTGFNALQYYNNQEILITEIKNKLKSNSNNLVSKVNSLLDENKELNRELESLKTKIACNSLDDIINKKIDIKGISVICSKVPSLDMNSLRIMADQIKAKNICNVIILGSVSDDKVNFVVMCDDTANNSSLKAGDIVKVCATICGGGGGGRPNMAQAGGKDPSKLNEALKETISHITEQL